MKSLDRDVEVSRLEDFRTVRNKLGSSAEIKNSHELFWWKGERSENHVLFSFLNEGFDISHNVAESLAFPGGNSRTTSKDWKRF